MEIGRRESSVSFLGIQLILLGLCLSCSCLEFYKTQQPCTPRFELSNFPELDGVTYVKDNSPITARCNFFEHDVCHPKLNRCIRDGTTELGKNCSGEADTSCKYSLGLLCQKKGDGYACQCNKEEMLVPESEPLTTWNPTLGTCCHRDNDCEFKTRLEYRNQVGDKYGIKVQGNGFAITPTPWLLLLTVALMYTSIEK